jgi:hypothetical protein
MSDSDPLALYSPCGKRIEPFQAGLYAPDGAAARVLAGRPWNTLKNHGFRRKGAVLYSFAQGLYTGRLFQSASKFAVAGLE